MFQLSTLFSLEVLHKEKHMLTSPFLSRRVRTSQPGGFWQGVMVVG